jgi:N-acetylmuramoyl-L-alanine amidase
MPVFQPIILTGDYLGPHDHQQQAFSQQCVCVVEFHFNSSTDAGARGGEVHYKQLNDGSRQFAEAMWAELAAAGLPPHGGDPVKSTAVAARSRWIDHYRMPAVVLEPLFISSRTQAVWLHNKAGNLADAVVEGIKGFVSTGGRIGLSAGHAGKSAADPGASCVLGDTEADHTVALRDLVARRLT